MAISLMFLLTICLPACLLYNRLPTISFSVLILAVLGSYCVSAHLGIPLWLHGIILTLATWLWSRGINVTLPSIPTLLTLLFCFLVFIFRWEPPGSDPVKWASLARLYQEYQTIPGDTRPLTPNIDLKGASMGVPITIALVSAQGKLPIERATNFVLCFALFLFTISIRSFFKLACSERSAEWASLVTLILFTNPMAYLMWGGTPTLLGFAAIGTLFEFFRTLSRTALSWIDLLVFGLALSFSAYAHSLGFYLALWIALPSLVCLGRSHQNYKQLLGAGIKLGILSLILFSPFFLTFGFDASSTELTQTWDWQKQMAPYLFRSGHATLYNLYTQVTSYLWSTAALISFALLLFVSLEKNAAPDIQVLWLQLGIVFLLVLNARYWILPLSFLIYPERAGTLAVLPLGMAWAMAFDRFRKNPWCLVALGLVIGGLSFSQFLKRLYPSLTASLISLENREFLASLTDVVPASHCIPIPNGITEANWIPPLAFRCTIPFHGLSMNAIEEGKDTMPLFDSYSELKSLQEKGKAAPKTH